LTGGLFYVLFLFMTSPPDIAESQDRMLGELADLAMGLARDMAAKARDADSLEDAERFTLCFERVARSVRLSIALQRRLGREARRDLSAERSDAVGVRKAQLRAAVRTVIRTESGLAQYSKARLDLESELDERLAEDALHQAFLDAPLDLAVAELRRTLGLPAVANAAQAGQRFFLPCRSDDGGDGRRTEPTPPPPSAFQPTAPLPRYAGEEGNPPP
jgi:hypothetical protein